MAERKLTTDIVTGGSATSLACLFTNPLEVVKTRLQIQGELAKAGTAKLKYNGLTDVVIKMAREEGVFSLQKGLGPGMIYQFFMNGARLGSYPSLKRILGVEEKQSFSNLGKQITAGAISGALGAIAGSPFYMIKCRLQAASQAAETVGHQHKIPGVFSGLAEVFHNEGFAGLFRGVNGAVPRVMVGSASQLATYDSVKRQMLSAGFFREGMVLHFSASMVSGLVVTTMMNPFDVVSTRLYNQPQGQNRVYAGFFDCFAKTFRAEGLPGFFKGWLAHYARLGPHTVLSLVFWEQTRLVARKLGL